MESTYNPIICSEELGRGLFQRPPAAEPGVALVFSGNGRELLTVMPGEKTLTWGESRWNYTLFHKVDLTEQRLAFQCNTPCAEDGFQFDVEVSFLCKVSQPKVIVEFKITDVAMSIKSAVEDRIRTISRNHQVEQSQAAEEAMRKIVPDIIHKSGFDVKNFTIKVLLPEEATGWIQDKTRTEKEAEIEKIKITKGLENQLLRQNLEQKMELKREKLNMKIQNQKMEMQKQKVAFYNSMLQSGQLQLLALQLAQNPEDVQSVILALNQQKQMQREHDIRMLKTLIGADAVEGWQLTELNKRTLQNLIDMTDSTLPILSSSSKESANPKVEDSAGDDPEKNFEREQ
jgi:hypothetical protein